MRADREADRGIDARRDGRAALGPVVGQRVTRIRVGGARAVEGHVLGPVVVGVDDVLVGTRVRRRRLVRGGADRDRHRRAVRAAVAVRDPVFEVVHAGFPGVRRVGHGVGAVARAHLVDRDRALHAVRRRGDVEAVALGIRVVGEHVNDHGEALVRRRLVVACDGIVVDPVDRDGDRGDVRKSAVGDRVGEAVDARRIEVRRVGHRVGARARPVVVYHDRADRALRDGDDIEAVAIGIAVVCEHVDLDRDFLVGRCPVVAGNGLAIRGPTAAIAEGRAPHLELEIAGA